MAVIAGSLLNFFDAKRLPIKKQPLELEAPPLAVGVVTLKGRKG